MTPIILFFFFLSMVLSSSSSSSSVSREWFGMDGEVAWVVQVSDLHISAYHPDRAQDLVNLLSPALTAIRPHLLLITGDITDAKNRRRTSTRQDESEWIQYKNAMDAVVSQGGIDKRRIFDIRGNHDKYGVPYVGSSLDFFSLYSVSSQLNRLSNIHSISLVGHTRNYIFLGIDDTISIGIRGPSNLFGHPTDESLRAVESELQYLNNSHSLPVTKVVFGHFPISFTAASEKGAKYEQLFSRQSVSAYICGHLHAKFSKQLWRFHMADLAASDDRGERQRVKRQFWEWELGDWKEFRLIRILAVDEGKVSFLDLELFPTQPKFQTTILITYPTDSRSMNHLTSIPRSRPLRNDINALIFSALPILNVTAKVLDSSRDFRIVEEVPLQPVTSNSINEKQPLFHAKWNAENYRNDPSAVRYWLQVFVLDSEGNETVSSLRPFSVEGKMAAEYPSTWLALLVIGIRWEDLYSILVLINIGFIFMLLFLPKLLNFFMERSASYQKWAMSVSISSPVQQRRVLFSVLWFLIEGSRGRAIWFTMVLYHLYLLRLPWFWGYVTSENGDIAPMYMFGWRVNGPDMKNKVDGMMGNPDVMTVTLPFMYLVVTPLVLVIYCLFAERSAACLKSSSTKTIESEQKPQPLSGAPLQSSKVKHTSFVYRRTRRNLLLPACLIITCIHIKQCCSLMGAYGVTTVALSPAFSWVPPLLLAAAIYSTGKTW